LGVTFKFLFTFYLGHGTFGSLLPVGSFEDWYTPGLTGLAFAFISFIILLLALLSLHIPHLDVRDPVLFSDWLYLDFTVQIDRLERFGFNKESHFFS
jgi:hypothetical protein